MLTDRKFQVSLLFFIIGFFLSVYYSTGPLMDFVSYYFGSRLAMDGVAIHAIYEPYQFNLLIRDYATMHEKQFFANYAVVPPFNILFFTPFALAPASISKLAFNLLSVFFFSSSIYRLLKMLNLNTPWLLLLPLLFFIPFRNNILFGQSYLLLAALLMEGYMAGEKKKNMLAAVFYSIAIALKIFPAILLVFLIFRKQFRLAAFTILFSILFFLTPMYFTGFAFLSEFIFQYLPRIALNEINNPYAVNYQSFAVLLKTLLVPDAMFNPEASFNSPVAYSLLAGIFSGLLFFLLLRNLLNSKDSFPAFAFTLFTGLLITSYSSTYSLILLLPMAVTLSGNRSPTTIALLILLFIAVNLPLSVYRDWPVGLRFPRLYLLLAVYAVVAIEMRPVRRIPFLLAGSVLVFTLASMLQLRMPKQESDYFFKREEALLIYDFSLQQDSIRIKSIGIAGPEEKRISLVDSITTVEKLALTNNQVYFNKQLTFGNDHKRNPVLVNNKYILYLSDKGRGIGFYTLRIMRLSEES